jgi:SAM-dependent methyltransferase
MRPKGFHINIEKTIKTACSYVTKNSGWKKVLKCPLCKSKLKIDWLEKNKIKIFECKRCSTGYSSLVPRNLKEIYELDSEISEKLRVTKIRENYYKNSFIIDRINFIMKFKKKGDLLDYGCGTGIFAGSSRNFFNTEVFDYSEGILNYVKKKYNIKTYNSENKIKKKFDIITLYDVIEHLENPIKTLNLLSSLLKKKGIIVIYTPNKNSLAFDYLRENSNLCTAPYHLTYFTPASFNFLNIKNIKIVYLKTFGLDLADIFAFLRDQKKLNINEKNIKPFIDSQKIIDSLGYSNHLRLVLEKY